MVEPIAGNGFKRKPGTITSLPFLPTDKTKLGFAPASYMVTAFSQLDGRFTAEAPLQALFLHKLFELLVGDVLGTIARAVHFPIALATDSRATLFASTHFAAQFHSDVVRLDPFPTTRFGAVNAVLGGELEILAVPIFFKCGVEQFIHVLERDMIRCAAFGRHMGRVGHRHTEDPTQTIVAHSMGAS